MATTPLRTQLAATTSDPNIAVALRAAAVEDHPAATRDRYRFLERLILGLNPPILRSTSVNDGILMDALAAIADSADLPFEHIACAMRHTGQGIELIVASSTTVSEDTIEHIRRVFDELRGINAVSASNTQMAKQKWGVLEGQLYAFSAPALRKVLKKNLALLKTWLKDYEKTEEKRVKVLAHPEAKSAVRSLLENLEVCDVLLQKNPVQAVSELIARMKTVEKKGSELLDDTLTDILGLWGGRVSPGSRHFLRHGIEDLVQFPRDVEALRNFAFLWPFESAIQVDVVPIRDPRYNKMFKSDVWPSSLEDWGQVRKYIHEEREYKLIETEKTHTCEFTNLPLDSSALFVHPQLKVARYILEASGSKEIQGKPFLNYIAASGLSCRPCSIWLAEFNNLTKLGIKIRGTNFEWPPLWGMPELKAQELGKLMMEHATRSYLELYDDL